MDFEVLSDPSIDLLTTMIIGSSSGVIFVVGIVFEAEYNEFFHTGN